MAAPAASGGPTAAISRARATRRSIRSTRDNFNKLEVAWRFKTDNLGPRPEFNFQATPLMVERRALHDRRHAPRGRRARRRAPARCCGCTATTKASAAKRRRGSCRAAASRTGPTAREERIIYVTPGYQLIALDAKTGAPIPRFGKNGIVDLKLEDDQEMDLDHRRDRPARGAGRSRRTSSSSAPRTPTGSRAEEPDATRRATSAASTCGPASACGSSTRSRSPASSATTRGRTDSVAYTGNTGVWAQMSVDEELGTRLPAGRDADRRLLRRPSARQQPVRREPRRARPEDRQAQVALPARAPRHLGQGHPVRADPRRHHRRRPARSRRSRSRPSRAGSTCSIASPASRSGRSRSGRSRRATCRASGTRRRSRSSPSRRRSSGRASSIDDLIDFTPELRAEAVKLASRYKIGPIFTPPVVSKWRRPARHADAAERRPAARTGRAARSIPRPSMLLHLLEHRRVGRSGSCPARTSGQAVGHGATSAASAADPGATPKAAGESADRPCRGCR